MNINILGTKVHVVLVFFGALCVLMLFGCIGVISWGGWKMYQQDEAVADLRNLKTENEKSKNETKKLSSQLKNLNETLQNETQILNQTIQLIQKFQAFLFNEYCSSTECLLCQTGWIFYNESCYFLSDVSMTWDESRRFCQFKSADLVVINNLQEQKFIYDNIKTNKYYWLGIRRDGSYGSYGSYGSDWVWIDGRINTLWFWSSSYQYSPYSYGYMYQTGDPTASWGLDQYTYTYTYWYQYTQTQIFPSPLCEQKAFKVSLN